MAFPPQMVYPAAGIAVDLNFAASDLTGPVSYTTGGVTVGAGVFNMLTLYGVFPMDLAVSGNRYVRVKSISGPKAKSVVVLWFEAATNSQVAPGTNLSAEKVRCVAFGV